MHLCTSMGDPMTPWCTFSVLDYQYRCQNMRVYSYLVTVILCDTYLHGWYIKREILIFHGFLPHLHTPVGDPMTPSHDSFVENHHFRCQSMQDYYDSSTVILFATLRRCYNIKGQWLVSNGFLPQLCSSMGDPLTPSEQFSGLNRHYWCPRLYFDQYEVTRNHLSLFPLSITVTGHNGKIAIFYATFVHPHGRPHDPTASFFVMIGKLEGYCIGST